MQRSGNFQELNISRPPQQFGGSCKRGEKKQSLLLSPAKTFFRGCEESGQRFSATAQFILRTKEKSYRRTLHFHSKIYYVSLPFAVCCLSETWAELWKTNAFTQPLNIIDRHLRVVSPISNVFQFPTSVNARFQCRSTVPLFLPTKKSAHRFCRRHSFEE